MEMLAAASLAACGFGSASVASLIGSEDPEPARATVSDVRLVSQTTRTSPLVFEFQLTDTRSLPIDVDLTFSIDGGQYQAMQLTGDTSTVGLASSPNGVVYQRQWDYASQLMTGSARLENVMLRASVGTGDELVESALPIPVGNDAPVVSLVHQPTAEVIGPVVVEILLADSGLDQVDLSLEYRRLDDSLGWRTGTSIGNNLTGLASSVVGLPYTILWDAPIDEPNQECTVRVRLVPDDGATVGALLETNDIRLDNNAPPLALLSGSAFLGNPDNRFGIVAPFEVQDIEGDAVNLVYQWGAIGTAIPDLPSTWAEVQVIRASEQLRTQYQIATQFPTADVGRLIAETTTTARLLGLAREPSWLADAALVGRELQVLRASRVPGSLAATWSSSNVLLPVAALPLGDGRTVAVLDQPSSGQWRLHEVQLSDGLSLRTLGSGSGTPSAAALFPSGDEAIVAADQTGTWLLQRVDLDAGTTASWHAATGASVVGVVQGIAAISNDAVVMTIAASLVHIDRSMPAMPQERVVTSGLQVPVGVVQLSTSSVCVAERDWVDPLTSFADGRVAVVEIFTGLVSTLDIRGLSARRPTALAIDAERRNLWLLGDANTGDSTLELQGVRLSSGIGGEAFELSDQVPATAVGLAAGEQSLLLYCDPAANELAVGGGIAQVRTVTAWDTSTSRATVDPPFLPAPGTGSRWRIGERSDFLPSGASVRRDAFVWDSRDADTLGEAVLRVTPFDTDRGTATDTGVPRAISASLQVTATTIGGSGQTGIRTMEFADFNADGLLDVVTGDYQADAVSVFYQTSPGVFSIAPSVTIYGSLLAPLDDLEQLLAVDVDDDGDLDIVCVSSGSDDIAIIRQTSLGVFVLLSLSIGTGLDPVAVAAADLNGDERVDLVVASQSSNQLEVYFQLLAGLYQLGPDVVLSDPSAVAPVDVVLIDIDGDGDQDILAANVDSDNLTVHLQTAPGVFDQPATFVVGGSGTTDAPIALATADWNGDGRVDIACANRDGNNVTVFLQLDTGLYPATPTATLSSTLGPFAPRDLLAVDFDADGIPGLAVADAASNLLAFFWDPEAQAFVSRPLLIGDDEELDQPTSIRASDLTGDGLPDISVANTATGNVAIYVQAAPGNFAAQSPSLWLGSVQATPGVNSMDTADIDNDGDLDIVTGNAGNGTLTLFAQIGPGLFASSPETLVPSGALDGIATVLCFDCNGDTWPDLLVSDDVAGAVVIFHGTASGVFAATASQTLGGGVLQNPGALLAADLDADGDMDLACADTGTDRIYTFRQDAGVYVTAPWQTLGDAINTINPNSLVAVDLNFDGNVDLACSADGSNCINVFLQTGLGTFATVASSILGGVGLTPQANGLIAAYVDGDERPDLVCLDGLNDRVLVFLGQAGGAFLSSPTAALLDPLLSDPRALCAADLNGDSRNELVIASHGSDQLVALEQLGHGLFPFPAVGFGGTGQTTDPSEVCCVDLDGDGNVDVLSVQPQLSNVTVFFNSH